MASQPPPVADEREGLLRFLDNQRYVLRLAAYGLTDEQARSTPTRSALGVGGLIKHVAAVETMWIDLVLGVQPRLGAEAEAEHHGNFRLREDETLAGVLDAYAAVADRTTRIVADLDLGHEVPVPKGVPWYPDDLEAWSVRWVLLHLIEETARHAGHADIVREHLDGATAFGLLAAAEGWPETSWLKPWRASEPLA
ncbi:DinB family protein [Amycolatopsis sp. CA-230715]|uniref:DinB family protein n=1 Tax=Amycolatopsis sp. CA-230715 TaxID=2745196 RepID=UPI001C01D888|nr:DinB family protein [Amycolatopsis sp. CA-230715]QWF79077.1 hypothetical protein HUW46_02484 [Amycolatopsis sp. CA-230715]